MQMQETQDQVILEPQHAATHCIIWMHGLGADGYDFIAVAQHMARQMDLSSTRFLFPHAPVQPVTFAAGESMRSWYDILAANPRRLVEPNSLNHSVERISNLIQQQVADGVPSQNIFLVGFSQGGAVAWQTASEIGQPLGGMAALSTYMPLGQADEPMVFQPANQALAVFIGHGSRDGVVPISLGEEAKARMSQHGSVPQWHSYPMQHEVCVAEINDLCAFLQQQMHPA